MFDELEPSNERKIAAVCLAIQRAIQLNGSSTQVNSVLINNENLPEIMKGLPEGTRVDISDVKLDGDYKEGKGIVNRQFVFFAPRSEEE